MKRVLLIDGDIWAYQAAAAAETVTEFDDQVAVTADKDEGIEHLETAFRGFQDVLGESEVVVCLTDYDNQNFRKAILPSYKSKRGKKPILLSFLRSYLIEKHKAKIKPTLEADDLLGILATNRKLHPGCEKIIVTIDKDLQTVPGLHFNPNKDKGPRQIGAAAADLYHLRQTLIGDPTDSYVGCPGVGPVGAAKIVSLTGIPGETWLRDTWLKVVTAFEKAGLTAADALVQARVSRILRHSDFDYTNQRPILWQPSKAA